MRKVYVTVYAAFYNDGHLRPISFVWDDGHEYEIDRILDVQPAASLKVGGFGTRYTIKVQGKQSYLWLEHDGKRWFMEGKR